MNNRWLNWLNIIVLCAIILAGMGLYYFWVKQADEIVLLEPQNKQNGLPKGAFELENEAYEAISGSFLNLNNSVPTLQIPDLKSQLIYHGRNVDLMLNWKMLNCILDLWGEANRSFQSKFMKRSISHLIKVVSKCVINLVRTTKKQVYGLKQN